MTRRKFLQSLGIAAGAGLASSGLAVENEDSLAQSDEGSAKPSQKRCPAYPQDSEDLGFRGQRSILFLDYFPLVYHDNVAIHQSTARYIPESYFVDPLVQLGYSQVTSQVFFDAKAGLWKRYAGRSDVFAYESEDAISWRISPVENIETQKHPHHVFTSHSSALGSIMHDPNARDGFHFKALCLGGASGEFGQALQDPASFFHRSAKRSGGKATVDCSQYAMMVSRNGLNWEFRPDFDWGYQPMRTEEHFSLFYNHHMDEYVAAHRIRWGDRRVFFSTSKDLKNWEVPRQAFHPDVLDEGRIEFHGEAIQRYDSYYIALLWYGNYSDTEKDGKFWPGGGSDTCHLAHSYDGQHFVRGHRRPLIPLEQDGQPKFTGLWTRGFIEKDDEILIYTDTWGRNHDQLNGDVTGNYGSRSELKEYRNRVKNERATVVHRLRKDGFTYLAPEGGWGIAQTYALTLFEGIFTMNAEAMTGEIRYEILGKDIPEGYAMDDCLPFVYADSTGFQLRFRNKENLDELIGKQVWIRFKMKSAKLYAIRGNFSTDPSHMRRVGTGEPLYNTSWLY